jgi:hypothetical protein
MDQLVRRSGIFYFQITNELQTFMLAQVAMAWTIGSCIHWSILLRGCQRLFHANYMTRYMSGLVKDLKFSHHTFGTCCPRMMATTQECMLCRNQTMKAVERASQRQRTLQLLMFQTLYHCLHLQAVNGNLHSHNRGVCKQISSDPPHHQFEVLHHTLLQVQVHLAWHVLQLWGGLLFLHL